MSKMLTLQFGDFSRYADYMSYQAAGVVDWYVEKYNDLLLDIGSTLMVAGAHCGRIDRNIKRIADVFGVDIEIFYSFNGIILTTKMRNNPSETATHYKRLPTCDSIPS